MLHFLFPKECFICNKIGDWLCPRCKNKLINTLPNCYICRTLSNNYKTHSKCSSKNTFEQLVTLWKYNEYSKVLMHNFKYKNRFQVGKYIYSLMEDKIQNLDPKETLLIPVPSNIQRLRDRGFNPTQNICESIKERKKVNINYNALYKKTANIHQASLSYNKRQDNVYNTFGLNNQEIKKISNYKKIIIVDDIITTGSTLNEVCRILKPSVAQGVKIYGLTIFQGSFKKHESERSLEPN